MPKLGGVLIPLLLFTIFPVSSAKAAYDPLSVPNNKIGIHLISPNSSEADSAKNLVNANGDWGYVTVIIENKDKDHDKWQTFFNQLRRDHLIPLVRIATEVQGQAWRKPSDGEIQQWADFLNSLTW